MDAMRKYLLPASCFWFLAVTHAAHADPFGAVALGLDVGTYGIGGTATTDLVPGRLNLNFGGSAFNYGTNFTADSAKFKADATLGGEEITLSAFPLPGYGFNVTAGLVLNQNDVKATARPQDETYTFNGTTYTAAEAGTVSGKTHFNSVAPYVGIGWGNPVGPGSPLTFILKAGAMYEAGPGVRLIATGAAANPLLASNLAATQATINHDLNFLSWYPTISIGLSYRF